MSPSKWMQIERRTVELPDGIVMDDYYVWKHNGAVMVVPLTGKGTALMTYQYKNAADDFVLEFPAGNIDTGEDPTTSAVRELREEVGVICKERDLLRLPTLMQSPPKIVAPYYNFLLAGAITTVEQSLDLSEAIEIREVAWSEIGVKIQSGGNYRHANRGGILHDSCKLSGVGRVSLTHNRE